MAVIPLKQLLDCGVHFGHQTRRWNPKMKPYIFDERNGIYIIDLQKTSQQIDKAYSFIREWAAQKKKILFIGTKKQAQECIEKEAKRCEMFFVNNRWLGGMLTNFTTIKKRIEYLKDLEKKRTDGYFEKIPKKEVSKLEKKIAKLEKSLSGIKEMKDLPDIIFVVDPKKEHIAVKEARKLNIPIIGIVDTNCDPDEVDLVIPANDDAIKSIKLIVSKMADAVIEGNKSVSEEIKEKQESISIIG